MYTTLSQTQQKSNSSKISLVNTINKWIAKEETNYFGICGMMLIIGTAITSIPVAIATGMQLFVIVGICAIFAMAVNVMVISQQTLKTVTWTFLIGMTTNILLLFYLLFLSF